MKTKLQKFLLLASILSLFPLTFQAAPAIVITNAFYREVLGTYSFAGTTNNFNWWVSTNGQQIYQDGGYWLIGPFTPENVNTDNNNNPANYSSVLNFPNSFLVQTNEFNRSIAGVTLTNWNSGTNALVLITGTEGGDGLYFWYGESNSGGRIYRPTQSSANTFEKDVMDEWVVNFNDGGGGSVGVSMGTEVEGSGLGTYINNSNLTVLAFTNAPADATLGAVNGIYLPSSLTNGTALAFYCRDLDLNVHFVGTGWQISEGDGSFDSSYFLTGSTLTNGSRFIYDESAGTVNDSWAYGGYVESGASYEGILFSRLPQTYSINSNTLFAVDLLSGTNYVTRKIRFGDLLSSLTGLLPPNYVTNNLTNTVNHYFTNQLTSYVTNNFTNSTTTTVYVTNILQSNVTNNYATFATNSFTNLYYYTNSWAGLVGYSMPGGETNGFDVAVNIMNGQTDYTLSFSNTVASTAYVVLPSSQLGGTWTVQSQTTNGCVIRYVGWSGYKDCKPSILILK